MFTGLRLANFKSLGEPAALALGPLTLLCGPNSSGKSSVLQALLLLGQSTSGRYSSDQLQLNGVLVELGTFDEVVYRGEKRRIGLGLDFVSDPRTSAPATQRSLAMHSVKATVEGSIDLEFSQAPSTSGTASTARLERLRFTARTERDDQAELVVTRRRGRPPVRHLPPAVGPAGVVSNHDYVIQVSTTVVRSGEEPAPATLPPEVVAYSVLGVELQGVVPQFLWASYNPVARHLDRVLREALRLPSISTRLLEQLRGSDSWGALIEFWSDAQVREILGPPPSSADDAAEKLRATRPSARPLARSLLTSFVSRVERREGGQRAYERRPLPSLLEIASEALTRELSGIRHLGPLRQPPRAFHSLPTSGDPLSVGGAGEYTAAVLSRRGSEPVRFEEEGQIVEAPLASAVNHWLGFLRVHSEVQASEFGKIGHFVGVTDESLPRYLDLTQVGVGMSQILPVLVQCLIAPTGSSVVLEQPELHLHPAVQSRLAHFLLSVSRAGRLILCETHSEYLVNRLRILIAQDKALYGHDLRVYFTERFQGLTSVQEVVLGPGTSIPNWPSGFFDQSVEDASELLAAQLGR